MAEQTTKKECPECCGKKNIPVCANVQANGVELKSVRSGTIASVLPI